MLSLSERKSIRKYSEKEVDDALLKSLLQEATHTQTMGNLQLYSVIITRELEMKEKLLPAHFFQSMIKEAPVVLTFCADYRRTTTWGKYRKGDPGYDNFLSFINAASDALLYCQTFCNIAEDAGLGLCYLGTTIYNPKSIIDVLNLPKLVMPIATITLGWPNETPNVSERLPIEAIVHDETYHDYNESDIDNFYHEKEELPINKEFVRINGTETLAQIFTDIRYKREDCELMSKGLLEALKQQGFLK